MLAALVSLAAPALAATSKRFALVIGNSQYANERVSDLPNAANDAKQIAQTLTDLGFEVDLGLDLGQQDFKNLVSDFRAKIREAQVKDVVLYYAGHGFSLDGFNHLVPVDAMLNNKNRLAYETLTLDEVIGSLRVSDRQNTVVLLDSCRNNPLPEKLRGEATEQGFSELRMSLRGIHVSFATDFGQVTGDGLGNDSPYARALLKYMKEPGLPLSSVLRRVTNSVAEQTGDKQYPVEQGGLREDFYFNPGAAESLATVAANVPAPQAAPAEPEPAQPQAPPPQPEPAQPAAAAPQPIKEVQSQPDTATDLGEAPQQLAMAGQTPELGSAPASGEIAGTPVEDPSQLADAAPAKPAAPEQQNAARLVAAASGARTLAADGGSSGKGIEQSRSGSSLPAETKLASLAQEGAVRTIDQITEETPALSAPTGRQAQVNSVSAQQTASDLSPSKSKLIAETRAQAVIAGEDWTPPPEDLASPPPPAAVAGQEPVAPLAAGTQVAALTQPGGEAVPEPPPEDAAHIELARRVEEELARIGCFNGTPDGKWARKSEQALQDYYRRKGRSDAALAPSQSALDDLTSETADVCAAAAPPKKVKPTPPPTRRTVAQPPKRLPPPQQPPPRKTVSQPPAKKPAPKVPIIIGQ